MICPVCMRDKFVEAFGTTHYVCIKNDKLPKEDTGCGAQFLYKEDNEKLFPYNVIFKNRSITKFFKYDHLKVSTLENE